MWNLARGLMSAIGLVVVLILFMAAPAAAKMTPFFTVAIDPAAPVAGEPMVVVVRTWSHCPFRRRLESRRIPGPKGLGIN